MIKSEWIERAFSGSTLAVGGESHVFAAHRLGEILLPTGRLAASDPFVQPKPDPFGLQVAPGAYPVDLAVCQVSPDDQRVAFARVTFAEGHVARWSMISAGDQDASALGDEEIFGYGVDAGTGCFMAAEAGELPAERMKREDNYFERMIEEMQKTYRHTWSWAKIQPEPTSELGILAFSSGYGDGVYASYLGLDAGGRSVCVVTDFGIVSDLPVPDAASSPSPTKPFGRRWWRFWN
jgi:hypothetical protein